MLDSTHSTRHVILARHVRFTRHDTTDSHDMLDTLDTTLRTDTPDSLRERFGNGHRSHLVTGKAPVTNQVLQMSQER
jgi:hypothetical protein